MTSIVGVDIGGTKTHILAESLGDRPGRAEIEIPSATWRPRLGDFDADARGLADLLVARLGPRMATATVAVGAHGCENTSQCRALERALVAELGRPAVVVNDSELIAPAVGVERGIGVVVGTGSIATARDGSGALISAGGWGWLLGDEGSAAGLVREGTRAVLDALDRGEAIEGLGRRLMAAFGAHDGDELALAVTDAGSAECWGRRAPEVFAAADEGSALADAVIRDAGDRLADLVGRVLARGIPAGTVVAGGAVIQRQPRLQRAFAAALARSPAAPTLSILDRPPVEGALALARRLDQEHR
jgi:glucosamine kinase